MSLPTGTPPTLEQSITPTPPPEASFAYSELWQGVLSILSQQLSAPSFETWIRPLAIESLETETLTVILRATSEFNRGYVKNHYQKAIETAFAELLQGSIQLQWIVKAPITQSNQNNAVGHSVHTLAGQQHQSTAHQAMEARYNQGWQATTADQQADQLIALEDLANPQAGKPAVWTPRMQQGHLNPRYTFEQLVVGPYNRFCHAAAMAIAEQPAIAYNPFFVHGSVGLGKTHLVQAIGHYVLRHHPRLTVKYVTTEEFTNDLIQAIATKKMDPFRERYRKIDVLMIDDIQFLEGKDKTQEEMFHTFNALHSAGKQIILTSDRPPKALARLEERLISRFEWGLIADVQTPDAETRIAILRKKAEREGLTLRFHLEPEVLRYLAETFPHNIRELEGAFNKLSAKCMLEDASFSMETAQALFGFSAKEVQLSEMMVLEAVAAYFNVDAKALQGGNRAKELAHARQVCIYVMRELLQLSFPKIGQFLGDRKHTTILYGYEKMKEQLAGNVILRKQLEDLIQKVKNYCY